MTAPSARDLPLPGGAAQQLHPQRPGNQGLHLGQPPVFAQIVQILQDKEGLHPADIGLHPLHHLVKGHAAARPLHAAS
mgnify:CR=1 FL=1